MTYILSHHGHRTGNEYEGCEFNPGTWCYYIMVPEPMYSHRWDDFKVVLNENGFGNYPDAFTDGELFDTEVTFAENLPYFDRKDKTTYGLSKVGCDYAHLRHREMGYLDTFTSVNSDAQRTVEKFLKAHPDFRVKSGYSNMWGDKEEFYEAKNGCMVHKTKDKLEAGWLAGMWGPKE